MSVAVNVARRTATSIETTGAGATGTITATTGAATATTATGTIGGSLAAQLGDAPDRRPVFARDGTPRRGRLIAEGRLPAGVFAGAADDDHRDVVGRPDDRQKSVGRIHRAPLVDVQAP